MRHAQRISCATTRYNMHALGHGARRITHARICALMHCIIPAHAQICAYSRMHATSYNAHARDARIILPSCSHTEVPSALKAQSHHRAHRCADMRAYSQHHSHPCACMRRHTRMLMVMHALAHRDSRQRAIECAQPGAHARLRYAHRIRGHSHRVVVCMCICECV